MLSALGPTRKARWEGGRVLSASGPIRKAEGGGGGGGCYPLQARYEKREGGISVRRFGPDTKSGEGGLFSRRGGGTLYQRGGCNPPPGSASDVLNRTYHCGCGHACMATALLIEFRIYEF